MVNLKVLGNCAAQTATLETTSFVIETDKTKILLDAGPGVVRQLRRANMLVTEIDSVIVSHCHGDHVLGFPFFMFNNFIERTIGKFGPDKIPVIALDSVFKGLSDMTAFSYPPGTFPGFEFYNLEASPIQKSTFDFNGIEIATIPVTHSAPTIAVRFTIGPIKIVFSCDTSYNENLIEFAKDCDLLVHEAFAPVSMGESTAKSGHSTAEDAGKVARAAGAKMLMLTHMSPMFADKPDILIKEAGEVFEGTIIAPSELEVVSVG